MTTNKKTECLGKLLRIELNIQSGEASLLFEEGEVTWSDGRYPNVDTLVRKFKDGSLKEVLFQMEDAVLTSCDSNSKCKGCRDYRIGEIGSGR